MASYFSCISISRVDKIMKKILVVIPILFGVATQSFATPSANYMAAEVEANKASNVQLFEYGRVNNLGDFNLMLGGGRWWTTHGQDSFFFRTGVGFGHTKAMGKLFMPSLYIGPSYIVHTDGELNRNFAFCFELNLMLVNSRNMGIGLTAKHFATVSNAPGRDFYGIRVLFP